MTKEEKRKQGQQMTASAEEAAERAATGRTQGRKGCKAERVNIAFRTDNHSFLKYGARAYGMNMTEFMNTVMEKYRQEHPEAQAKADEIKRNADSLTIR